MVKIYNGDCLEVLDDLLKKYKVDIIITDLPYGVTTNENDTPLDLDKMWKIINKYDIPFISTSQQPFTTDLINSNRKNFRQEIIWNKVLTSGFLNANRRHMPVHENIILFSKKAMLYNPQKWIGDSPSHSRGNVVEGSVDKTNQNYGKFYVRINRKLQETNEKFPTTIIKYKKPHPSAALHATAKPVELYEYLVKTYTNEGQTVLDLTMGSGTTGVACIRTNRNFIGIEKDIKAYNIAKERIENEPIIK